MNKLLKGGLVMFGLFAGCSQETTTAAQQPVEVAKGKVVVVYFSWGGNTRFAAETIAKKAGAARTHLGHAEQGRAQGQDGVSLPDAWRRRDGARRQGVRGGHWRRGEGPAA